MYICENTRLRSMPRSEIKPPSFLSDISFENKSINMKYLDRKMNSFFELCCENHELGDKTRSDNVEGNLSSLSRPYTIDVFNDDGSLKLSGTSRSRKVRVNTMTAVSSSQAVTVVPNSNNKVDWFKNPMFVAASESAITSPQSTSKTRKWVSSRVKKIEKPVILPGGRCN